jgi:hypothetical protein
MNGLSLNAAWLRLRLALGAVGPVVFGALALCVLALAALAWLVQARELVDTARVEARRVAALPPPAPAIVATPPATDDYHLALFEAALGERRHAEQGVKTLFKLAGQAGLTLRQGEYKAAYDRNARLHTYQVTLPVKGSYGAIWQFALGALRAIPFAALDEISFKRDAIGEANVEARLRLTFYLTERPGAAP